MNEVKYIKTHDIQVAVAKKTGLAKPVREKPKTQTEKNRFGP